MSILDYLVEPFTLPFMTRAMVVTVIAAVVCALLSCWLVMLGWSLMGDAISHAVLPGVVLAYIAGIPFAVGAVIAALVAVTLIGAVQRSGRVREDAAIGIVFTTLFALGLVLVSVTPSSTDLNHILFGNVLGVSWPDVWQVAILAVIVAGVLLIKRRDFILYAFDRGFAHAASGDAGAHERGGAADRGSRARSRHACDSRINRASAHRPFHANARGLGRGVGAGYACGAL